MYVLYGTIMLNIIAITAVGSINCCNFVLQLVSSSSYTVAV